jgi:hypothetical protein
MGDLPEGQPSPQHSANQWPDGSHTSIKGTDSPLGVCQKAPKGLSYHENLWSDGTKFELWLESQASRLEETWHNHYGEAWWWPLPAVGMFFSSRGWGTSQDWGKDERHKVQRSLIKNLLQSAQDLRLGRRSTFQQDNDPKHTAKTMQE